MQEEQRSPDFLAQEKGAVKAILSAYIDPETTMDGGVAVTAFMEELAVLSKNEKKFKGLMRLCKTSPSALLALEEITLLAFRTYVNGEEAYIKDLTAEEMQKELEEESGSSTETNKENIE